MTSRHWTGVFIALFAVLWLSMCSYTDAQEAPEYEHPPFLEVIQLPFPVPACSDPADPENGLVVANEMAFEFQNYIADGVMSESELDERCRILPPGFPVAFLWEVPGVYILAVGDEWYRGHMYGMDSPLTDVLPGLWYALVIEPWPMPDVVAAP